MPPGPAGSPVPPCWVLRLHWSRARSGPAAAAWPSAAPRLSAFAVPAVSLHLGLSANHVPTQVAFPELPSAAAPASRHLVPVTVTAL